MSDERTGWLSTRWSGLASGPKMLLILSLALLPLGIIAIISSVYSARENSAQRAEQTLARLNDKAERLDELLERSIGTMRAASAAVAAAPADSPICERLLIRLASLQLAPGRYALHGPNGRLRCATEGFTPPTPAGPDQSGQSFEISRDGQTLHLALFNENGTVEAIAEFSRDSLGTLSYIPGTRADFNLELTGGGRRMLLREDYRPVPFVRTVSDAAPIADGRLMLRITLGAVPIRPIDVLVILLPVMMWIAAGLIGWWIVNWQLLRPLATIQRVVSSYRPGERPLELPALKSPAREIGELGAAFDEVTRTVARHEAELEEAVERQTRLVREVHHRVKNNLQVVASLLNLHSRGSSSEEAAAAYASIQRRVDALAVVHRNHYAELEENRGVALKPLISELAANLRATAPAGASGMQIRLAIGPYYVTQDVAVSVAFLVTEITEFGMLSGAALVSIMLEGGAPGSARLSIEVDSLAGDGHRDPGLSDRFERIITGLARQLRSALDRAPESGRYSVVIAVVERGED
ncbi:sensor histidine kinase [Sphingosinicella sp. CPCC 101087]|uniref:sensor histidine kinase n=1 Tax=Sphingosinicella sp. CPCC 101087 TaxID=2497754 RepID=UPI00101D56E0|nr:sensor histidine kinase [Sphingosinicella sp. CPCC 101087]